MALPLRGRPLHLQLSCNVTSENRLLDPQDDTIIAVTLDKFSRCMVWEVVSFF